MSKPNRVSVKFLGGGNRNFKIYVDSVEVEYGIGVGQVFCAMIGGYFEERVVRIKQLHNVYILEDIEDGTFISIADEPNDLLHLVISDCPGRGMEPSKRKEVYGW